MLEIINMEGRLAFVNTTSSKKLVSDKASARNIL
jgi:hypothetical protein